MQEVETEEKQGFFSKIAGIFSRTEEVDESEEDTPTVTRSQATVKITPTYRNHVTVRTSVKTFEEALAAANGLKRGEQQILNLTGADPTLRQKVVDFLSGVNYAQEGTWAEIGPHIYLMAPAAHFIEVEPMTPRTVSFRN